MNLSKLVKRFRANMGGFTPTEPQTVEVDSTLESLQAQAKSLGIKGWNFYKSPDKLQSKIQETLAQN